MTRSTLTPAGKSDLRIYFIHRRQVFSFFLSSFLRALGLLARYCVTSAPVRSVRIPFGHLVASLHVTVENSSSRKTPERLHSARSVLQMSIKVKFERLKSVPFSLANFRSASKKLQLLQLALERFAPASFARLKFECERSKLEKSTFSKYAHVKFE